VENNPEKRVSSPMKNIYGQVKANSNQFWWLVLVFAVATGIRVIGISHDLPFSFYGDELHFIKRSMALGSGDLNPHWFHKPAFLMYILFICYGMFFAVGWLFGQFSSTYEFGAYFLQDHGMFLLIGRSVVAAFGVGTVYVVYKISMRCFNHYPIAVASAFLAAVLSPLTLGSYVVKADVPAGFFIAVSLYFFLATEETQRLRPLVLASLMAGFATGTKYYGIILIPVFISTQLIHHYKFQVTWKDVFLRSTLIFVVFIAGFFLVSPYNFLDPTWGMSIVETLIKALGIGGGTVVYDPDSKVAFKTGLGSIPGATEYLLSRFIKPNFFGVPLTVLVIFGLAWIIQIKRYSCLFILGVPILCYGVLAVVAAPYHVSPRHLIAVFPILCTLVGPGAFFIVNKLQLTSKWSVPVFIAIVVGSVFQTVILTVQRTEKMLQLDSRVQSHNWIIKNIPKDSVVLLDDYGPSLHLNKAAASRLLRDLKQFSGDEAFTAHQKMRLKLFLQFPPKHSFDLYELGHPWWLPAEISDEELRKSAEHRDMGNPLVSRKPKSLAEYRLEGIRYIVTNSKAQSAYKLQGGETSNFPSFVRFYRSLEQIKPIKTFNPSVVGGKGPDITVYDILKQEPMTYAAH